MAAATNGNNPMIIGAILIVGALLYSRSMQARATVAAPTGNGGSLPGSTGSGTAQVVGGLLGTLLQSVSTMAQNGITPSWQTWEPLAGVTYDPTTTNDVIGIQDIFNAGIDNKPVYEVETVGQIFDSVTGGGSGDFMRVPGAYW